MPVKIVTDSAADMPAEIVDRLGITVVPCNVVFGTEVFRDGVDISADQFYERLSESPVHPTTSQPTPGDFVQVYDDLGKDAEGIVSIHVSAKLSGTYNSAIQAKDQTTAKCPIEVVDSTQACMGIGVIVIAAAQAAAEGMGADEVAALARAAVPRSQLYFMFNTVEYLVKGGRIGKAKGLLGTVLRIKPLLIVEDGEVHELGKARTFAKGLQKLKEITREYAPLEQVFALHTTTPELAQEMAESFRDLLPEGGEPLIARAGPTIGTYAGPGVAGVALLQAE